MKENLTVPGMLLRMENQYRRRNDFGTEVLKMEAVRKRTILISEQISKDISGYYRQVDIYMEKRLDKQCSTVRRLAVDSDLRSVLG